MDAVLHPLPAAVRATRDVPCRAPREGGEAPSVQKPRDGFRRFLVISLGLHAVVLGAFALGLNAFRPPELAVAQGVSSLEIISISSIGQEGTAETRGDDAPPLAPEVAVTRDVVEEKAIPTEEKIEEQPVAKATPELEKIIEEPVPATADSFPVASATAAAPAQPKAVAKSEDTPGEGKKAAQAGSNSPSAYQPGSPGGVAAAAIRNPTPPYPEQARQLGVEGTVVLRLNIDNKGRVRQAQVVRSSGRGDFDKAAITTIEKRWRYKPALSWGRPVDSAETVKVCFVLGAT